MTTGLLYDPRFLDHDTGPGHPERSQRLTAVLERLERQPWHTDLARLEPKIVDDKYIEAVHASQYMQRAAAACAAGRPILDSMDTGISMESYEIARLAVGGALELGKRVMAGDIDNGFGLLRPPGHHAEQGQALGFCLFNNVAILARYLQREHGIDKVLILDWDVHHGNGTQHTFEEDPSVLYVSLHQYPFYPGTGAYSESGVGRGAGATLNCPMQAGSDDDDYRSAFMERILPKLQEFKPDFVLISAGFDAHRDDPLAQIELSTEFYGWMTARLMEVADTHAGGRLVALLEGGYDLQALGACVTRHLAGLSGNSD